MQYYIFYSLVMFVFIVEILFTLKPERVAYLLSLDKSTKISRGELLQEALLEVFYVIYWIVLLWGTWKSVHWYIFLIILIQSLFYSIFKPFLNTYFSQTTLSSWDSLISAILLFYILLEEFVKF